MSRSTEVGQENLSQRSCTEALKAKCEAGEQNKRTKQYGMKQPMNGSLKKSKRKLIYT